MDAGLARDGDHLGGHKGIELGAVLGPEPRFQAADVAVPRQGALEAAPASLPLIRRTLALAPILSVAGSVLAFDQFYVVSSGGPRNSTLTAVHWILSQSFVSFKLGCGAALSILPMAILAVASAFQLWVLRERGDA